MIEPYALTGVLIRGSNIKKDLRLLWYEYYSSIRFDVVTGVKGDCIDRQLIRMNEFLDSVKIIFKCIKSIKVFLIFQKYKKIRAYIHNQKVKTPDKYEFKTNMESMIHYFKLVTEGQTLPKGETYVTQEAPKGELGLYIVSDNTNNPYRLKLRSPDYYSLQGLNVIAHNHLLADLIPILGTVDFTLGSIDR